MLRTLCLPASRVALAALAALAMTGCRKPIVKVYVAPRDTPPASAHAHDHAQADAPDAVPDVTYVLPPGWQEAGGGQMSVASFVIENSTGKATVNITPLPNLAGREEAVVNMWREQVGLGPMKPEEVAKTLQPTNVAGDEKGQTFEIVGTRDGKPAKTITAVTHRGDRSWFFKISGDDATVTAQRDSFLAFAKAARFVESTDKPATQTAQQKPAAAPEGATPNLQWKVPGAWKSLAAGQMQVAKFAVPDKDGAKAEVSVSVFPNDTGGTLANVNRWRRQIGLAEVDEAGLKDCSSAIDGVPGAVLVNLINEQKQLLGAIVPRDGKWWFYKLNGDAPAVVSAHEDFVGFVRTSP